ncbi:MAG: chromosomal replication initiator protein DnaA [Oligosphaeraceae bacterium]
MDSVVDSNLISLWRRCLPLLRERIPAVQVEMWFGEKVARPVSLSEKELVLGFPKDSFVDWAENSYRKDVEAVMSSVLGREISVVFQEGAYDLPVEEETVPAPVPMSREKEAVSKPEGNPHALDNLNRLFSFQNFVVGENTRFAYNSCLEVAAHPGEAKNPLFLHGPSGLGKTHLLQAIARDVLERDPSKNVVYLTSEQFGNLYVEAVRTPGNQRMAEFRKRFRNVDVLLVDDVQFFQGKDSMQEEFFHTFNALYNSHRQIVCASDKIPQELPGLEKRLVSRFEWGLTVDITPPDLPTRVAILEEKQNSFTRKLPVDILEYLAQRIKSNVRNLESSLLTLQAYLDLVSPDKVGALTRSLVDKVVGNKFEVDATMQLTVTRIQEFVAHRYDVRIQDLKGKGRQSEITVPRQIAMYLSRKLTEKSLPEIAAGFEKSHPTVLHSISVVEKKIEKSEDFRQEISDLERKLCTTS